MNIAGQSVLAALISITAIIIVVKMLNHRISNLVFAPLVGVFIAWPPSMLSDDLMLNRMMWIVASVVAFAYMEWLRMRGIDLANVTDLASSYQRRSAARRAVRAEVNRVGIFEVEA